MRACLAGTVLATMVASSTMPMASRNSKLTHLRSFSPPAWAFGPSLRWASSGSQVERARAAITSTTTSNAILASSNQP